MMRMTGFTAGTGSYPAGKIPVADFNQIPNARGKIIPFFDDGSPCGPDGAGPGIHPEDPLESLQVFPVQFRIQYFLHIIGESRPLCINIKHDKGIKTIEQRNSLRTFQCIVQMVRNSGGRVDTDADQRMGSAGAQDITIFAVMIRHIDPPPAIIIVGGGNQRLFKGENVGVKSI